jgi:hypothetical protein
MQVKNDVKQQHEELVALLKAHPELTNSDGSTVRTLLSPASPFSGFLGFGTFVDFWRQVSRIIWAMNLAKDCVQLCIFVYTPSFPANIPWS